MEALKKQRRQPRRGATTTINAVDAELAKANPNEVFLSVSKQKLEEIQDLLVDLDEQILEAMREDNATDVEEDAEYDASQEYKDKIRTAIAKINSRTQPADPPPSPNGSMHSAQSEVTNRSVNGNGQRNFKLPKIELAKFGGDLKEWLGFWAQFHKIDEDDSLHDSDKFHYLKQAMQPGTEAFEIVSSFPASAANYTLAVATLKERFGRESLLLQVYIRELLQLVIGNFTQKEKLPLDRMVIKLQSHLRSLNSLNLADADPATWIFPLVESSLPVETLRAWQRSSLSKKDGRAENPPKTCLDYLMEFLQIEMQSEQRISLAQAGFSNAQPKAKFVKKLPFKNEERTLEENPITVAGLHVGEKTSCLFCDKAHESEKCWSAQNMTLEEKTKEVKNKKGCFVCLRRGHFSKACRAVVKCLICERKHNVLMCPDLPKHKKDGSTSGKEKSGDVKKVNANFAGSSSVLLGTFRATLINGDRKREVRALYDPGAQRSYLTNRAVEALNLRPVREEKISHNLFGGIQTDVQVLRTFHVNIKNRIGKGNTELPVLEKQVICGDIPRLPPGPWLKEMKAKKIWISDVKADGDQEVHLLVGADLFGKLLTGKVHQLDAGFTAIETRLGWVVMGSNSTPPRSKGGLAMSVINMHVSDDSSLEQLWSLEALGIKEKGEHITKAEREVAVKQYFQRTVTRKTDGRYSVRLPWIDGAQQIPNNFKLAKSRLMSATSKLKAVGMYDKYDNIFNMWRDNGIIEIVQEEKEAVGFHYLPHRPVFKPTSLTTPVRPVFDASCKSGRNPSLNECLEKGPNMLERIPAVFHRFREKRVGIVADITKAFLMMETHEDDRDYLRFLWWEHPESEKIIVMRHCRVVFGVNCSPFLLAAVLEHHLDSIQDERKYTAQKLLQSFYVDNCVTSLASYDEYDEFRSVAIGILAEAKMELCQWECTIGDDDGVGLPTSGKCGLLSGSGELPQALTNVLGYQWDKREDNLRCAFLEKKELPEKITKRAILSRVQQVFDPLGFLCPALLLPKILLQKSWELDHHTTPEKKKKSEDVWDSELPADLQRQFRDWHQESDTLGKVTIPRWIQRNFRNEEIHIFGDASQFAYATVAFIRVETEQGVSVQMLHAKSRVAPLKKLSIPRLELMACTISARLLRSIQEAIDVNNTPVYLWSDSATALAWIRRNDEWGTFVGNRVREILQLTDADVWRHVPGVLNPADLPSRGCSANELLRSKWWEGPEWLRLPQAEWPRENAVAVEEDVRQEMKKSAVVLTTISTTVPWYVKRYSRYSSNLRVFCWLLRYVEKIRRIKQSKGELSGEELANGERRMISLVQKEVFPASESTIQGLKVEKNDDGLLCVKTKITNRVDDPAFKCPILLPSNHIFTEQMIWEVHTENRHAGAQFVLGKLREKFWILQGRRAIKKIIRSCVICRRFNSKAPSVPEAPLPEDRVKEAKVFQVIGVDLAGPLFLKNRTKAWIVLFTCAVYRAVHLEMVTSLSTDAFLLALHRFISRRGRPEKIFSDNGTNFVGANNLFLSLDWKRIERDTRTFRIQWTFNPPSGAWYGGFFERLIRTIKDLLRKSLGHSKLNAAQLETVLCEVEAIVNGRPLTYITEDPNDLIPITPAMFMQDIQTCQFPEEECLQAEGLVKRYRSLAKMKEELRSRFRTEYLAQLVHRGKRRKPEDFLVGDVVLVGSDNKKRHEWPLAKIEELLPGKDGISRVAKVKTATGTLLRPLQRLYQLEVTQAKDLPVCNDIESLEPDANVKRTRYGRVVRQPDFFVP